MCFSQHLKLLCQVLGLLLLLLCMPDHCHAQQQLQVEAVFNQSGVQGRMVFSQSSPQSSTIISVSLTGLNRVQDMAPFPWHVHEYPFPLNAKQNPCGGTTIGGHYDPLSASQVTNYPQVCSDDPSRCEIGDLSGRLGRLTASSDVVEFDDSVLSLYGVYSIIGRSIVVHFSDGARFVCANIGYPSGSGGRGNLLYVPFRDLFSGNIYFRQHLPSRPVASVYSDLVHSNMSTNTVRHNWHVHEIPVGVGTNCMEAGPHYNPHGVDVSAPAYRHCNPSNQTQCEIGDLSNKGSPFDVNQGIIKQFYTDTDLPLAEGVTSEGFSIADRSVVIHAPNRGGPRIACATILRYTPLEAEAVFVAGSGSTISGRIRFLQPSPFERTSVEVRLTGLGGGAGGYHVHVSPIGPESAGFPGRCSGAYTGGHWDPLGVSSRPGDTPAVTSDDYEVGDLSGKFGSLASMNEIDQMYFDPNIPLFGPLSIMGRSVVIHRNDETGTRWACADITHTQPVVQVSYSVNTYNLVGQVTFIQPADDPFADTTIVVELEVVRELEPPISAASSVVSLGISSLVLSTRTTPSISLASSLPLNNVLVTSTLVSLSSSQLLQQTSPTTTSPSPEVTPTPAPVVSSTPIPPSSTATPVSTLAISPTPLQRKRRQSFQNSPVQFEWSLKIGVARDPAQCGALPILQLTENTRQCSSDNLLLCNAGDLSMKHGPLIVPRTPGLFRAVFTDPNLPLSGPSSPFSSGNINENMVSFLVQPRDGATGSEVVACDSAAEVVLPLPTTSSSDEMVTSSTTVSQDSPDGSAVALTASVGVVLFIIGLLGGLVFGTLIGVCWGKARYKSRSSLPVAPVYEDVVLTATMREEVALETNVAYGHFNQ